MGYKSGFIHIKSRFHSLFRFVWYITSQGQMSFIGRAQASSPACLKQTLPRSSWTELCTFHVYYLGLLGEYLG